MASFRQHVTFGALIGALGATFLYFYAFVTDPVLLAILFATTIIASFLIPFYMLFGTFTLVCAAWALLYALRQYPGDMYYIIGLPLGMLIGVWFVVGHILKKFTRHRGMMHSLPAMAIAGLLTFLFARYAGEGDMLAMFAAISVALGFASHLILDELHAELNMDGKPFIARRSLGTAMKLFSHSKGVTLFTYLLLVFLIYQAAFI